MIKCIFSQDDGGIEISFETTGITPKWRVIEDKLSYWKITSYKKSLVFDGEHTIYNLDGAISYLKYIKIYDETLVDEIEKELQEINIKIEYR